jgi:hypothetical protein
LLRHVIQTIVKYEYVDNFPDGDSAMFTKTSLGFSRIPNLCRRLHHIGCIY